MQYKFLRQEIAGYKKEMSELIRSVYAAQYGIFCI